MNPRTRPPANTRPAGPTDPPPARGEAAPALPPYPAYKPSGVAWLGDVPQHWEVTAAQEHCRFTCGTSNVDKQRAPEGESDIGCIRLC